VTDPVVVEDRGPVRWFTIDRPEVRNALDNAVLRAIVDVVRDSESDLSVRVVVIRGCQDVFCSGLDFLAARNGTLDSELWPRAIRTLRTTEVPTIAAVNGPAITGGMGLMLACDLAIAADSARFVDSHAKIRLLSGSGISTMLIERIGLSRAKDMMLTAREIDAMTAERWGLVNQVVPREELEAAVTERAELIAQHDPALLRATLSAHQAGFETAAVGRFDTERERALAWADGRARS
jgi:enoyl-CoA hydratase